MHLNAQIRRQPIDKRHEQPLGKLPDHREKPGHRRPELLSRCARSLTVTPAQISLADFGCLLAPIAT
jgi:hypothetical protein